MENKKIKTMIPQAQTIDEVITILEEIISETKKEASPLGYFAVLYSKVTKRVKEGIVNKEFEDGPRMENLDVVFANRYIFAYYTYKNNEIPSQCWFTAFKASKEQKLIVLQHLLLGMNAHINLDLGIAAAQISQNKNIEDLKNDFNKINEILASLVDKVENALATIWPILKWVLKKTNKIDTFLINFSMKTARDGAWKFAQEISKLPPENIDNAIIERDKKVNEIAKLINNNQFFIKMFFRWMFFFEKGTVVEKIENLDKDI